MSVRRSAWVARRALRAAQTARKKRGSRLTDPTYSLIILVYAILLYYLDTTVTLMRWAACAHNEVSFDSGTVDAIPVYIKRPTLLSGPWETLPCERIC